jgi:hypothetical protein
MQGTRSARRGRRAPIVAAALLLGTVGAVFVLAGDGGDDAAPLRSTRTSSSPSPASERDALDALAALDATGSPAAEHDHEAHRLDAPPPTSAVTGEAGARLARELDAARDRAIDLASASDALAAGYELGSPYAPGVGAHFVKWSLIDAPFDPARPSMLLYDGNGPGARLLGFSYWVASSSPPEGFTGGSDTWHRHFGLCIVDGQTRGEDLARAAQCARGTYLDGRNLWMLHAWVAPGPANRWGIFAAANPAVR